MRISDWSSDVCSSDLIWSGREHACGSFRRRRWQARRAAASPTQTDREGDVPLTGIRILDFGRYIAGPYCAALLADYGADVIRIEAPGGNDDRYTVPVAEDGSGAMFMQMNRAKRGLTLKPGSPEGRDVVRRLVETADVVIANLPHDALVKLGLDYDSLSAIKIGRAHVCTPVTHSQLVCRLL